MTQETADSVPIADGFDFPVGPRGENVNVFDTHKIDTTLVDPDYYKSLGFWHTGEDWNGKGGGDTDLGQPVYAIANGRVVEFGYNPSSWGNIVLLEHALPDNTRVWSQYAHLDQIMVNAVGQKVSRGQQVGTIGKGAKTTQKPQGLYYAHLHFEIRRNNLPMGNWTPMVKNRDQVLANYYNPSAFINDHRPAKFTQSADMVQSQQVIVDSQRTDPAAGLFRKAKVDTWYSAPYGYQGTMLWTFTAAEQESAWAEWRPTLPAAGQWEVFAYIPNQSATTTNARYQVIHLDGQAVVAVNQSKYNNEWVSLGAYRFEPGRGYVRLSDLTGETNRQIMIGFDAVRWVKVG